MTENPQSTQTLSTMDARKARAMTKSIEGSVPFNSSPVVDDLIMPHMQSQSGLFDALDTSSGAIKRKDSFVDLGNNFVHYKGKDLPTYYAEKLDNCDNYLSALYPTNVELVPDNKSTMVGSTGIPPTQPTQPPPLTNTAWTQSALKLPPPAYKFGISDSPQAPDPRPFGVSPSPQALHPRPALTPFPPRHQMKHRTKHSSEAKQRQAGKCTTTASTEHQPGLQKDKKFLTFTRDLIQYLSQTDPWMEKLAKSVIKHCRERHQQNELGYENVTDATKRWLNRLFGHSIWETVEAHLTDSPETKHSKSETTGHKTLRTPGLVEGTGTPIVNPGVPGGDNDFRTSCGVKSVVGHTVKDAVDNLMAFHHSLTGPGKTSHNAIVESAGIPAVRGVYANPQMPPTTSNDVGRIQDQCKSTVKQNNSVIDLTVEEPEKPQGRLKDPARYDDDNVDRNQEDEDRDREYAAALQQQEYEATVGQEHEDMLSTIDGRSYLLVERILAAIEVLETEFRVGLDIQPIAKDEMVEIAERFIETHEQFGLAGKPTKIDLGYHNTWSSNLESIKTDGLLSKRDLRERSISTMKLSGAAFGDGVYTANYPHTFKNFGDVGLLVARLQGRMKRVGPHHYGGGMSGEYDTVVGNKRHRHRRRPTFPGEMPCFPDYDRYDEVVLQSSSQVLPLIKFSKDTSVEELDTLKECLQKVLDMVLGQSPHIAAKALRQQEREYQDRKDRIKNDLLLSNLNIDEGLEFMSFWNF